MNDRKNPFDKRFLILGDRARLIKYTNEKKLKKIIKRNQKSKLSGVWGTLGWRNGDPFKLTVTNSENGNTSDRKRNRSTKGIISNIQSFNKQIKNVKSDVLEHYINFEKTKFDIDWSKIKKYSDIPELRLDLFVDEREGAMLYYQHQQKNKVSVLSDDDVYEQFIQCKKTDADYTCKRDRLTYFFKVLPPFEYTVNKSGNIVWTTTKRKTAFVIKAITFKRTSGTPEVLMQKFFSKDKLKSIASSKGGSLTHSLFGKKKYGLLLYDASVKSSTVTMSKKESLTMRGAFHAVDDKHPIDRSKKTLLLVHGTFSSTMNSFGAMVKLSNGSSQLQNLIDSCEYEQVIGFNHPTISADAFDNITVLKQLIGKTKFSQPIGMVAASRGCVLAQAIGATKGLPFAIDKCLMFSPANGVGYFDVGEKLATGLGILKKLTKGSPATYAFALLQFSSDFFLNQPGPQQMTFGSTRLNKVLNGTLANPNSKYTAVVNDWEKILIDKKSNRFWMKIADGGVKLMLGAQHDFVVGINGQTNMPPKYKVKQVPMASTHTKYFEKSELHKREGDAVVLASFMKGYL